jgi:ATP-dependent DNA ligase
VNEHQAEALRRAGEGARFVLPQLASPIRPDDLATGQWVAEEKYDGHRICVSVNDPSVGLEGRGTVRAWSRNGIERVLPPHVRTELARLSSGTYDGELYAPGKRSYGTAALENEAVLELVIFDVTDLLGRDLTCYPDAQRREFLKVIFARPEFADLRAVRLAWRQPISSLAEAEEIAVEVMARDGEGLILKRVDAPYVPGKRARAWMKIKALRTAVLTVVAWREGLLGPHSVAVLRDDEGHETTVKSAGGETVGLANVEANWQRYLGRRLRIEYQERTPDGGYRHPRWDRWEDQ